MFKMLIHITQEFETVEAAEEFYEEVRDELKKHKDLHINGQVVTKFTGYNPTYPEGRDVNP